MIGFRGMIHTAGADLEIYTEQQYGGELTLLYKEVNKPSIYFIVDLFKSTPADASLKSCYL